MIEILAQIKADKPRQFVAGLVLWDDVVVEAAPIIGFMQKKRWTRDRVREHCQLKGWSISIVHELRRPNPKGP